MVLNTQIWTDKEAGEKKAMQEIILKYRTCDKKGGRKCPLAKDKNAPVAMERKERETGACRNGPVWTRD